MRASRVLAALLLAAAVSGCGARTPTAPDASSAGAPAGDTFVLESIQDARLPAPGTEAAGVTDADRALLSGSSSAPDLGSLAAVPDAVVFWNLITESLGTPARLAPPRFARAYALVQVAIYDAVSVSGDTRRGRLSERALAAGAAYEVLIYLFPESAGLVAGAAIEQVAVAGGPQGATLGAWHLGRVVGRLVVRRAKTDGSDAVFTGTPPVGDGIWTGTNPVLPMAGSWKTWCLGSGSEIQPEPPYAYGSAQDLAEVQEVLDVSLHRTPEQIAIATKWATGSPSTIWNAFLNERILSGSFSTAAAARAQAYLNVAMADGFVCCWETKYKYWVARPIQRIPGLVTVFPTPNFPSYTSGHSTISAAAAEVLGQIFPAEAATFRGQAEEAAMSRLYGGIHFRHDNDQGLVAGKKVGERVVARMLSRSGRPLFAGR